MRLTGIVAHDPNRLIGANGQMPWHLPADLAFFKKTTSGHPIVMGRKTFESIGRALPKRQNIVLTRDRAWSAANVAIIHAPEELRSIAIESSQAEPVFIIGGAEIYHQFLPLLDELIVTNISQEYVGDTHFPPYEEHFEQAEILLQNKEFTVNRFLKR